MAGRGMTECEIKWRRERGLKVVPASGQPGAFGNSDPLDLGTVKWRERHLPTSAIAAQFSTFEGFSAPPLSMTPVPMA